MTPWFFLNLLKKEWHSQNDVWNRKAIATFHTFGVETFWSQNLKDRTFTVIQFHSLVTFDHENSSLSRAFTILGRYRRGFKWLRWKLKGVKKKKEAKEKLGWAWITKFVKHSPRENLNANKILVVDNCVKCFFHYPRWSKWKAICLKEIRNLSVGKVRSSHPVPSKKRGNSSILQSLLSLFLLKFSYAAFGVFHSADCGERQTKRNLCSIFDRE